MSSLLDVCPRGAWVLEHHAIQFLGLASKSALEEAFREGILPHVFVDHGKRFDDIVQPYNKHRFFFIQKEGTSISRPSINLASWVSMCESLEEGIDSLNPATQAQIRGYTNYTDIIDAFRDLKFVHGIVSSYELSGEDGDDGYRYGSNGGTVRAPSKASSSASLIKESEIYTRSDGKRVRRIKRLNSTSHGSDRDSKTSLSGFLSQDSKGDSKYSEMSGSRSVGADEGQIYTRADGKKVRRVRKSSASVSGASTQKKSLLGFLEKEDEPKPKQRSSSSVAGDQIAISKESSLTGEVYVRADGKKVRRVKKQSTISDENVEIITRPDGTKARRIRKTKLVENSSKAPGPAESISSTEPSQKKISRSLSGFFNNDRSSNTKSKFSGSHSIAGDQHAEGEIYVRADGKKVRRVRKVRPVGDFRSGSSLSGFLDSDASKPKMNGAATVVGDSRTNIESTDKPESEIYVRPDGKKVRRIRKTAVESSNNETETKKSLGGFLEKSGSSIRTNYGGSNSVAGDQIAISKESSLTGEVYVRADGKRVRRVKKTRDSVPSHSFSSVSSQDNVDIITRPDGKRVRRIRKTMPNLTQDSNQLSGFLESQSKSLPSGGAATVSGDRITKSDEKKNALDDVSDSPNLNNYNTLGSFLGNIDSKSKKMVGSASVAGDQIAVSKDSSLSGEMYIRKDGKKVRRVKKQTQTQPGDQVEIITRPDGTKVRRIRRAKKPERFNSNSSVNDTSLDSHLRSTASTNRGSSATVAGGMVEGEIYIRADGKKVRRVRKSSSSSSSRSLSSSTSGDQFEIYVRPDGKKVRRIRRSALAAPKLSDNNQNGQSSNSEEPSLAAMLSKDKAKAAQSSSAATVAGDDITGKSSLKSGLDREGVIGDGIQRRSSLKSDMNQNQALSVRKNTPALSVEDKEIVSRYKQMLNVGMPEGAVIQKMTGDGVDKNLQESVLSGVVTINFSHSVQPTMQVDQIATVETHMGSNVSKDDEEVVARYKKMLKMGMPEGAVLQKMSADGVSQLVQDSVFADEEHPFFLSSHPVCKLADLTVSLLSSEEEEVATRYRDFLKMGMPEGAVLQKMSADGVVQNIQDSVIAGEVPPSPTAGREQASQKVSQLTVDDEEIATKYRKLLKMGMPDGAVIHKMSADCVAQSIQDSVIAGEVPPPTASLEEASQKVSTLNAEEQDVATKYRKMLKMGMPEGAVIQKMSVDGVPQNIQDSIIAGEAPPPTISLEEVSEKSTALTAEEKDVATKYQKMLKLGMPEGAVIHKMIADSVAKYIQDYVTAGEVHTPPTISPEIASQKSTALTKEEQEVATKYQKMLIMGMPEGAVIQKMSIDGIAQNIQDFVIVVGDTNTSITQSKSMFETVAASAPVPEGMVLVQKDGAVIPDEMVLVPKEQAEKTIPEGMVAVLKEKVGEGVPEGYVLVPKDQVRGDPGDDLILVKKDQIKDDKSSYVVFMGPDGSVRSNDKKEEFENVDISGAHIVSMNDLPDEVEKMKKNEARGGRPRFLLQALPEDKAMEDDFIRKNLLPNQEAPVSLPRESEPKKKAAPSSSVAEVLSQMSSMGGDFDAEKMQELLEKLENAEKRQQKLEKQLAAAGVAIAEDIDYDICVKKVDEIGKRMNEIGGSDVTHPDKKEQNRLREEYFKLEQDMEKYNSALLITDEYVAEQERLEKKWEDDNDPQNLKALEKLRRHMPVEVRNMSEAQLTNEPSPNGKYLPKSTAKKFKRTNVLQIIRRHPNDIVPMHPSTLENMRVTGLTLTERRAIYKHIKGCGPKWNAQKAEKMTERKWVWFKMMKDNFKENLASYQRHVAQYGPPGAHPYATRANPKEGCPMIGKQCPLKADKLIDYDKDDYGYPDGDVYEVSEVRKADVDDPGAKAKAEALELMKEKKSNERGDALKKHYKGKLLQVAKANGSCESMDEMVEKIEYGMIKWLEDSINMGDDKSKLTDVVKKKEVAKISNVLNDCKLSTLDICGRSGMQLSGKKTDEEKPDPRSIIECSLAHEVLESFDVFANYVTNRLKKIEIADTRIKSTIDMLKKLLKELHERNVKTIKDLGGERLERSRKLRTQKDIEDEIIEKMKAVESPCAAEETSTGPPLPGPPRGGLMDALKGGRGRGGGRGGLLGAIQGRGGSGGGGGRGNLLGAIQGRGGGRGNLLGAIQGRGGSGGGGGRGNLLGAIQGRGGGRGNLLGAIQGRGGGRGNLLGAIQGRGGGRGNLLGAIQGRGGGRGNLLDAIQGRGGRGDRDRGNGGGRGGLLDAIQARGGGGD